MGFGDVTETGGKAIERALRPARRPRAFTTEAPPRVADRAAPAGGAQAGDLRTAGATLRASMPVLPSPFATEAAEEHAPSVATAGGSASRGARAESRAGSPPSPFATEAPDAEAESAAKGADRGETPPPTLRRAGKPVYFLAHNQPLPAGKTEEAVVRHDPPRPPSFGMLGAGGPLRQAIDAGRGRTYWQTRDKFATATFNPPAPKPPGFAEPTPIVDRKNFNT